MGPIQSAAQWQIGAARNMGGAKLTRLLLALTTTLWRAPSGLNPALLDHIDNLVLSGWTIRQAYLRNYLLWRNETRRSPGQSLIVFPLFSERMPRQAMNDLVLADLLAAERGDARRHGSPGVSENYAALALSEIGMEPVELVELAGDLYVTAVQKNWLL